MTWGAASDPPILLMHGVTSNAGIWWRVAPALAAAGHRVVAIDMPGHGRTQAWHGRHRFAETATDVAGFIRAAALDRPDLAVIGHSWGAMVTAHLPIAGLRPRVLILLDPPALTVAQFEVFIQDPTERPYATVAEAAAAMRKANPTWSDGDIAAKAQGLTEFNPDAVLAVLLENGDWDSGLSGAARPAGGGGAGLGDSRRVGDRLLHPRLRPSRRSRRQRRPRPRHHDPERARIRPSEHIPRRRCWLSCERSASRLTFARRARMSRTTEARK